MNIRRSFPYSFFWKCLAFGLVAGLFTSGLSVQGYVTLVCENDFHPPLIAFNFPCFPQVLDADIYVLTDSQTAIVSHGVTVVDVNEAGTNNKSVLNFNVLKGGVVTPSVSTTVYSYGQSTSTSGPTYRLTQIGTFSFPGRNFPLGAWPNDPNWQADPLFDAFFFNLDQAVGWVASPNNSHSIVAKSEYHYNRWAWSSFLGYEGPYLPGASAQPPVHRAVIFDLRGLNPDPNSPSGCPPLVSGSGCSSCSGGSGQSHGMATASLDRFHAGVVVTDTPIQYTPSVGPNMAFTATYRQRLINKSTAAINYSNLGSQWNCGWVAYISGGPTSSRADATYNAPDGNQYTYESYQPTLVQGVSAANVNQGDFVTPDPWTHSTLHYRQSPEHYERWLPDGTVELYAEPSSATLDNRLFFLTQVIDPQGNTTTLNYDSAAAANGQAVLTSVTDPKGGKLLFGYGTNNPLLITKVTRSGDGLSATFQYAGGQLTSITDPIGMTSSFHYVSGTAFIDKMMTPYGMTTFSSSDGATSLEADMTNPLGQTERVEYQESLSTSLFPSTEISAPSATGLTIDNSALNLHNSFYWTRRAMADAAAGSIATDSSGFYALAQVSHWAEDGQGSASVPLSTKMPLEGRVWYNYPGQSSVDYVIPDASGASTSPSATARVLDGGATQASFASYNVNGLVTQSIDPLGRTTNYNYDTNNIDLLTIKQVNGSNQDLLGTMTYNAQHEPLTVTDAAGQTATMSYYTNGQLNTRTVVVGGSNQTTTMTYDSNGYPYQVTGPITGAITTYGYDVVGRNTSVKDSEGYILNMAYDNLDRLISTTYPDNTTDLTAYRNLDVDHTTDRQGRVTRNTYDAIREILSTTDPLGRSTKYTWCTCGGLSTLTDANSKATTWGLDLQGRVTSKTYADSTAISYVYETNESRLHTMTDARGSVATYSYNVDNTLSGTTYSLGTGVSTTPNVSFTYDTPYNRVLTMVDGTGTTSYAYNAITGSSSLGAGRLHTVTSPIAGTSSTAVVAYTYDELGRVVSRTVDGGSTVGATFDALGRVTNITNPLAPTSPGFQYAYVDTTSRLSSVTYPSGTGLSTSYSYFNNTGDQRLQEIKNLHSTTQLSKFDYTYNAVGTIATWTQQADSSAAVVNTLSYDGADQLINAAQSGGGSASNAYHYDPAGNRLAEVTSSGATAGQFNSVNQLTGLSSTTTSTTVAGHTSAAVTSATVNAVPATISSSTNFAANVPLPAGTNVVSVVGQPTASTTPVTTQRVQIVTTGTAPIALTYDANGNCTTDENGNSYKWDALNRLKAIIYNSGTYSGTHTEFAYDGLSRRVQIVERAGTTVGSGTISSTKNYLWIGQEITEERDASDTVQKRFFPQGEQQSGTNYYYTWDHLGSFREMLNSSATIVARYSYDPYGRTTLVSGTNLATKEYAGYYAHQTSGLYLTRFRAFDPNTGRWLSRDPLGERGGLNQYEYSLDDPTLFLDPSGLCSVTSGIIWGATLGGAGGFVIGGAGGTIIGAPTGPGAIVTGGVGAAAGLIDGALYGGILGGIYCLESQASPISISTNKSSGSSSAASSPNPVPRSTEECEKNGGRCEYYLAYCMYGQLSKNASPKWGKGDCIACYLSCKQNKGIWPFGRCKFPPGAPFIFKASGGNVYPPENFTW